MDTNAAALLFLLDLFDEQVVKVIPEKGRNFVGMVHGGDVDQGEPVLNMTVNNQDWRVRWSAVERIKLHRPREQATA